MLISNMKVVELCKQESILRSLSIQLLLNLRLVPKSMSLYLIETGSCLRTLSSCNFNSSVMQIS